MGRLYPIGFIIFFL